MLTQQETTSEEEAVDRAVKKAIGASGELRTVWGSTLYHIDDVPFR